MTIAKDAERRAQAAVASQAGTPSGTPMVAWMLADKLRPISGVRELAVAFRPEGVFAFLALDGKGDAFHDREEWAMEQLAAVRRNLPDTPIELVCVSPEEAAGLPLPSDAYIIPLP